VFFSRHFAVAVLEGWGSSLSSWGREWGSCIEWTEQKMKINKKSENLF
jgi:hypothetical protein